MKKLLAVASLAMAAPLLVACGHAGSSLPPQGSQNPDVVSPNILSKSETVVHSFTGGGDGEYPQAGLIRDDAGNLYGTTEFGGASSLGTVFELTPDGTETVLYSFTGGSDGENPYATLISDEAGNLYGTTVGGGGGNCTGPPAGCGVVFEVAATRTEMVLYSFTGGGDGAYPLAGLTKGKNGEFFGATEFGGSHNYGTIFKLTRSGHKTVLHSFTKGHDGRYPGASLIADSAGNLYGTTENGGARGFGTVFEVAANGSETVLYSFTGRKDGGTPLAGLITDKLGNLFGTTVYGGRGGYGTVFKLTPSGTETVLYSFSGGNDGGRPQAGLIRDKKGNLFGTTVLGGASGLGTAFKLAADGKETVLHSFSGGSDGATPVAPLKMTSAGNLYGTTIYGGGSNNCQGGCGTVFEISP